MSTMETMMEALEDTSRELVPVQDDAHLAEMPCYAGVPNEVVQQCETAWAMSKAVRLEALRRIRDALAPYGQFKQWCQDHGENYKTVKDALSRAYGEISERASLQDRPARSLPEPPSDAAIRHVGGAAARRLDEWREANPGKEIDEAWWAEHIKEGRPKEGQPSGDEKLPENGSILSQTGIARELGVRQGLISEAVTILRHRPDLGYQAAHGTGTRHTACRPVSHTARVSHTSPSAQSGGEAKSR